VGRAPGDRPSDGESWLALVARHSLGIGRARAFDSRPSRWRSWPGRGISRADTVFASWEPSLFSIVDLACCSRRRFQQSRRRARAHAPPGTDRDRLKEYLVANVMTAPVIRYSSCHTPIMQQRASRSPQEQGRRGRFVGTKKGDQGRLQTWWSPNSSSPPTPSAKLHGPVNVTGPRREVAGARLARMSSDRSCRSEIRDEQTGPAVGYVDRNPRPAGRGPSLYCQAPDTIAKTSVRQFAVEVADPGGGTRRWTSLRRRERTPSERRRTT